MKTSRRVKAVCISRERGKKSAAEQIQLIENLGVDGDFHAKGGERQVSLLANESVDKMLSDAGENSNSRLHRCDLRPGIFGENIITEGIDLLSLSIGQKIKIGEAEIEISRIGKECVERCQIYYQTGDCIMPREGVFARVINGGVIKAGDEVKT